MAKLNPEPDYVPSEELLACMPTVSGNAVNGLGETEARAPSPFFWHPPERQTHGDLQQYVMGLMQRSREGGRDWGDVGDRGPALVEVAADRREASAAEWTEAVKTFALANEADMAGIAAMDPLWVYEGYAVDEPRVIVLGLAQAYEMMRHAPPGPGTTPGISLRRVRPSSALLSVARRGTDPSSPRV